MNHLQNATAAALIVGYFAAHAAALLVHLHAPDWFQGLVTTVLTVLAGVLPTVIWNPGDNWKVYLVNVVAQCYSLLCLQDEDACAGSAQGAEWTRKESVLASGLAT
jgi:hypothetical protein